MRVRIARQPLVSSWHSLRHVYMCRLYKRKHVIVCVWRQILQTLTSGIDVTLSEEVLVQFVHGFRIVSNLFIEARLFRNWFWLVACPQNTDELVLPILPFVGRFKALLQDTDFYVCFEIMVAAMDVFAEFIIVRPGFWIIPMITKSGTQLFPSLSDINQIAHLAPCCVN